jgi:predicted type IV restriction endonuclease
MEKLLLTIRDRLSKRQYVSESAVREAIVLPVLHALGWDIFDPERVLRECSVGARRVDYALSASPPRRDIFIEVKAVGSSSGADRQLFEYAFHEGIPFAILTDGQEWNFFLPGEQGTYDDRRVQKLDLLEREPRDAADLFARYLSYTNVSAGKALDAAKADYRSVSRRKIAAGRLREAWVALLSEPDGLLLDLLSEKTESLCGYRPDAEDVEDFVLSELPSNRSPAPNGNGSPSCPWRSPA